MVSSSPPSPPRSPPAHHRNARVVKAPRATCACPQVNKASITAAESNEIFDHCLVAPDPEHIPDDLDTSRVLLSPSFNDLCALDVGPKCDAASLATEDASSTSGLLGTPSPRSTATTEGASIDVTKAPPQRPAAHRWSAGDLRKLEALMTGDGGGEPGHEAVGFDVGPLGGHWSVEVFFPLQFHALRHVLCGDDVEFVRCLARTSSVAPKVRSVGGRGWGQRSR